MNRAAIALSLSLGTAFANADAVDLYIRKQMETEFIPGACVAIVGPKGETTYKSFGVANLETGAKFSPDTAFRVASLSKQFCAYLILTLEKQGKLSRADTLAKYFPGRNPQWEEITISYLLAHRSGIPEVGEAFDFRKNYSQDDFAKLVSGPLTEKPGETFRYNNYGYALLGLIVEKVSGESIQSFAEKAVFGPVGMTNSRFYSDDEVIPNRADSYRRRNNQYINTLALRPQIFQGSGGLISTMRDFVAYDKALRQRTVLDGPILDFQWTPYAGTRGYGAGWYRERYGNSDVVVHTGTTFGFTSCFLRDLTTGTSVIVFRNAEGTVTQSARTWARAILDLSLNPPKVGIGQ